MKSYERKISRNFHDDGIPKQGSHCICLSVILIGFVSKIGKNYYFQVFLEDCKYIVKGKKLVRHITNDLETSSD